MKKMIVYFALLIIGFGLNNHRGYEKKSFDPGHACSVDIKTLNSG
ncbi:hypothetical protein GCM10011510_12170 [Streptococcus himalayensis]|uniref:Uncharacterized protein n=1 Tax=Streptococcus himalayensis TaxID=1888195 RepID=A0A917EF96_9STRE|nr:hypothetical protein GCM10011510_12170 [Streptococcus himalayensis]